MWLPSMEPPLPMTVTAVEGVTLWQSQRGLELSSQQQLPAQPCAVGREVHSSFAWTHCLKILLLALPLPSATSAYQLQPLGSKKRCLLEQLVGGGAAQQWVARPPRVISSRRPRLLEALAFGGMQTRVKH